MNLEDIKYLKQMLDREEITLQEFEKAKKEIIADSFDIEAFCSKLEEKQAADEKAKQEEDAKKKKEEFMLKLDKRLEEAALPKDLEKINIQSTKQTLTQSKFKKYRGYNNLNLDELSLEIKNFFESQKFGWLGEAKPQVFIKSDDNKNQLIKCFTAKTLVRTWGNSSETAINVLLIK